MPLSASDPYFRLDPGPVAGTQAFANYKTFMPAPAIGVFIVEAINHRLPPFNNTFEQVMSDLIDVLSANAERCADFLELIDDLRADGIVLMTKRRLSCLQYHTAEHAEELAFDVEQVLIKKLTLAFPSEELANTLFISIAKAAATWHDVVQTVGPPENEIQSAIEFAHEFSHRLTQFVLRYSVLSDVLNCFKDCLEFIGKELIFYATWLVIGLNDQHQIATRTLRQYVEAAMADMGIKATFGPYMQRMMLAGKTISQGDTTRFAFDHVLYDFALLASMQVFSEEITAPLTDFFKFAQLDSNEDKETFLGLHCQDLRMFTELNLPFDTQHGLDKIPLHSAHISVEDYHRFVNAFDANRATERNEADIDYAYLYDIFLNVKNVKADVSIEKRNIVREQIFAASLQNDAWIKHAENLKKLDSYTATLDTQSLAHLARVLFALATRYQPGLKILEADKKVKTRLLEDKNG
jgi:hypothetical protein